MAALVKNRVENNKKEIEMKSIPQFALTMLLATLMIAVVPTEKEGEIYKDTIRLHILANSDSREDQDLKIAIRDFLLKDYGNIMKGSESIDEAKSLAEDLQADMAESAEGYIRDLGYDYSVDVQLGQEWYDTREYDGFTLPAGYYTSLRVIIGDGAGQNWWCVMYPPMCMKIACDSAPADDGFIDYTKEEISLIKSGKYNIKFKILEQLAIAFAKNG